jgi:Ring finger domain
MYGHGDDRMTAAERTKFRVKAVAIFDAAVKYDGIAALVIRLCCANPRLLLASEWLYVFNTMRETTLFLIKSHLPMQQRAVMLYERPPPKVQSLRNSREISGHYPTHISALEPCPAGHDEVQYADGYAMHAYTLFNARMAANVNATNSPSAQELTRLRKLRDAMRESHAFGNAPVGGLGWQAVDAHQSPSPSDWTRQSVQRMHTSATRLTERRAGVSFNVQLTTNELVNNIISHTSTPVFQFPWTQTFHSLVGTASSSSSSSYTSSGSSSSSSFAQVDQAKLSAINAALRPLEAAGSVSQYTAQIHRSKASVYGPVHPGLLFASRMQIELNEDDNRLAELARLKQSAAVEEEKEVVLGDDEDRCAICQETYFKGAPYLTKRSTCSHVMHANCFLQFDRAAVHAVTKCPICKVNAPTDHLQLLSMRTGE